MNKITLPKASQLTSPNPVTLVCTHKPDGTTNLATVSWWTYLSFNPGMIAYAMAKTSYSGEMVRGNKKVILTIPGEAIAEQVVGCGKDIAHCGGNRCRKANAVHWFSHAFRTPASHEALGANRRTSA